MAQSFKSAYLSGALESFYQVSVYDIDSAKQQQRNVQRATLATSLATYAQQLDAPQTVMKAIEKLRHPASRTIVTGQQTGLLLGPTYTLSKAMTALKLAQQWHTDDAPVVAVFWLASQDHDIDEINHAYLLDMQEVLHRLEVMLPQGAPAGRISMRNDWVSYIITTVRAIVTTSAEQGNYYQKNIDDVLSLIQESADISTTFSDFFAALLYRLLGDKGLIILNPLDNAIAPLFTDVLTKELHSPLESSQYINQAGNQLSRLGYTPQLGRGEGATNLFIEHNGTRQLLRFEAGHYYLESGETFSVESLQTILANDPSKITPAAGLRPITQDAVLPTLATVVGPGELRYIAQLRGVYEHHDIAMPLLIPRMTVTTLEPPIRRILDKYNRDYNVTLAEILEDLQSVRAGILLARSGHAQQFTETLTELEHNITSLLSDIQHIDTTLENTVTKTQTHILERLERLQAKAAKALENHDAITTSQFKRLEAHLFPLQTPQERRVSPFSFFLKFGIAPILDAMWELDFDSDDWNNNDHIITF